MMKDHQAGHHTHIRKEADFLIVIMVRGIARVRVRTTTATVLPKMTAILQLIG